MYKVPRLRALAAGLALALTATACGGGEADDTEPVAADPIDETQGESPDDTDGETSTDTEAAQEDFGGPLRVILSSQYNLPLIGADAADHLGIFDDMGLEVELIESQDVVPALASGDADIAIASPNRFIGGIMAGLEASIVGPTIDVWDQFFIVRADMDVESLQDFPGGKIGISGFGSAGHYSAEKVASELGLEEGADYEIVTMGNLDGLKAGLSNGTIDAFAWSAQAALSLQQAGDAKILGHVSEVIGPNPLDVITVSNATIQERPQAVRAFCEAYYEGQRSFKEDEELATQVFVDEWDFDAAIAGDMVAASAPYLSTGDEMTDEMFDNMADATEFTIEDVGDVSGEDVRGMYTPCSDL
jgi:ABC-type nitrate/sulfonate/bicarbonate transport system substrate-binding protein